MSKDPTLELAEAVADLACDRKARDILTIDLRGLSSVADYFVLATGRSHIHVEAICQRISEGVRDRLGTRSLTTEGVGNGQWAIIDYGGVVVHVFQESARTLYDLERLWREAPRWSHEESSAPETDENQPCFDGP